MLVFNEDVSCRSLLCVMLPFCPGVSDNKGNPSLAITEEPVCVLLVETFLRLLGEKTQGGAGIPGSGPPSRLRSPWLPRECH